MTQSNRLTSRIVVALLAALMTAITAYAAVPSAPTDLAARVINDSGFGSVFLSWNAGDQTADGYDIYMSVDGGLSYRLIDRTSDSLRQSGHEYLLGPLTNGTYHFQIGAYNADGEGGRSNTASVVIDFLGVRFSRQWGMDTAFAGVAFIQDFNAVSSDNGAISYSLAGAVQGMTINSTTGAFTWTPTLPGNYTVTVVAALASDPTVKATFQYTIIVRYNQSDLCAVISGTVSDESGNPVPYAEVMATIEQGGATARLFGSVRNGEFSMAVPEGTMFVYVSGSQIVGEFYPNTEAQSEAERITLACGQERDLAITVELVPAAGIGWIEGSLVDTAGNQLSGRVIAYRLDSTGVSGQATETWARGGMYGFYNLAPGEYIVWGEAIDSAHVPGYHVAGDLATSTWADATRITVTPGDSIFNIEILLVYLPGQGGTARLSGTVVAEGGSIRKQDDAASILGTTPVDGATVYAIDANDNVFGYAVTDASGNYAIAGLKQGAYTVLVDKIGFKPLYAPATVADNAETDLDLTMQSTTSGVSGTTRIATSLAVYPNPVNASAMIRFDAGAGETRVKLVDLRGNEVISRTVTTTDGENSIRLETSALSAGIYLLQLGSGADQVSTMITVAH